MKHLTQYITEKIKIDLSKDKYEYHPQTREELDDIIYQLLQERGNGADLNDIDISKIKDLQSLFIPKIKKHNNRYPYNKEYDFSEFNGDISDWDVSNVENMGWMFCSSKFTGDISNWNTSSVTNMKWMFNDSEFNGDISDWDVSNVTNMCYMFNASKFTGKKCNLGKWDVSSVTNMNDMFSFCKFKGDLSNWKLNDKCIAASIFYHCPMSRHKEWWPKNHK